MSMTKEEIQAYTEEVAKELGETKEKPIRQITQLIELAGRDFVQKYVDETKKIEAKEGLKTDDGKRRRTPGGVFFYIIKGKLDAEIRKKIFPHFGQREKAKVVKWEERHDHIDALIDDAEHGPMRYVTLTIHGRPGKIVVDGDTVMTTISHSHRKTPLPRGVPHPPETATLYTVYMSLKHWQEVAETIDNYKGDRLIAEGTIFYDAETESIAMFATQVTTRRLQKAEQFNSDKPSEANTDSASETDALPDVETPDGMPAEAAAKLKKLHNAAATLRERIADMEAKGQKGVSMTKTLLKNTEKQIETLEKQYAD